MFAANSIRHARAFLMSLLTLLPSLSVAQVYKCEIGGRVIYQEMACASGSGGLLPDSDRLTVIDPPKPRSNEWRSERRAESSPPSRPARRQTSTQTHDTRCAAKVKRLARIDAQARQRSTTKLANERREVLEWIQRNGCSRL